MNITPREMLCPDRLRNHNYNGIGQLYRMDEKEEQKLLTEDEWGGRVIFFPLVFGIGILNVYVLSRWYLEIFTSSLYSLKALRFPIHELKATPMYVGLMAIILGIVLIAAKFLFPKMNLDKGNQRFHNQRLIRLQKKIIKLNSSVKEGRDKDTIRELNNMKVHFVRILRSYS